MKKYSVLLNAAIITLLSFTSCKKFLDVGAPRTETAASVIFADEATATSAMLSIYGEFMRTSQSINASLMLAQSADEITSVAPAPAVNYYASNLNYTENDDFWTTYYQCIYRANAVIEGVTLSTSISDSIRRQLTGEALFVRAFFHFYLVNLFGDIPYQTTTDYKVTNAAGRSPVADVYTAITNDLKLAKPMLNNRFLNAANIAGTERVRPNKIAAHALLARTYLYMKDWNNARLEADSVISNSITYSLPSDVTQVFKKNSTETIWQLMPSSAVNTNGFEGFTFIMQLPPSLLQPLAMNEKLWNTYEPRDKRRAGWIGILQNWHYPFKYKVKATLQPTTEYSMVLRLAEMYLVRAEARAELKLLSDAIADIDMIRLRAGISPLAQANPAIQKEALLDTIMKERYLELFTEWGHRWLDLKRTGRADAELKPLKGDNWQPTDVLFPIPKLQMELSPAFKGKQNPGYIG